MKWMKQQNIKQANNATRLLKIDQLDFNFYKQIDELRLINKIFFTLSRLI